MRRKLLAIPAISGAVVLAMAAPAYAQEIPEGVASQVILDNIWVFIAGVLVFFMQAGFALVEAGLTRAKNVGNIMMKNLMDCMAGVLAFALVGYSIGFGDEAAGGWFSWGGLGIPGVNDADASSGYLNLSPATNTRRAAQPPPPCTRAPSSTLDRRCVVACASPRRRARREDAVAPAVFG